MHKQNSVLRLLSAALTAALLLHPLPVLPARATQPQDPPPTVQTEPAATESIPETTVATIPAVPETTAAAIPTVPETSAATVPETTAATVPETTAATIPEATVPETTIPEPTTALLPQPTEAPVPEPTAAAAQPTAGLLPPEDMPVFAITPETTQQTAPATAGTDLEPALFGALLPPQEELTRWYPVTLDQLLPTDTVAIVTQVEDTYWAMSSWNTGSDTRVAVQVYPEGDTLISLDKTICWKFTEAAEDEYILQPVGELQEGYNDKVWLCSPNYFDRLLLTTGRSRWSLTNGILRDASNMKVLVLIQDPEKCWNAKTPTDTIEGTPIQLWRLARPDEEARLAVTFQPEDGTISTDQSIILTCGEEHAVIYYAISTDGAQYTDFADYTGPITPPPDAEQLHLKVYAVNQHQVQGAEICQTYTLEPPEPTEDDPNEDPVPGTENPSEETPGTGDPNDNQDPDEPGQTPDPENQDPENPSQSSDPEDPNQEEPSQSPEDDPNQSPSADDPSPIDPGLVIDPEVPAEEPEPEFVSATGWKLYFGQLHAHTNFSDGLGTVEEAFTQASQVQGLDFFAVTDHSNSFDNADAGAIGIDGAGISQEWARGKAAATAVTGPDFVGIFGYEMTWQEGAHLGHINTFNTPGWQSRTQPEFGALSAYYQALTTVPSSVSQFNHPGGTYGDFEAFTHYRAEYDRQLALLEVGCEDDGLWSFAAYTQALDAGWHVAPTMSGGEHNGSFGSGNARTVVLAQSLSEQSLYEAMLQRRVYATQDRDLSIVYRLNGQIMGSVITASGALQLRCELFDPTDEAIGTVEVLSNGGAVVQQLDIPSASADISMTVPGGQDYYYLRITQPDGDVALTAPVWVESFEDVGIEDFTTDAALAVQGQELTLRLSLFNQEDRDFAVEQLDFYADEALVHSVSAPGTAASGAGFAYSFPYTHTELGAVDFLARASVRVAGELRTYEQTLTLSFQSPQLVASFMVDGGHGNAGLEALENLTTLAARSNTQLAVLTGNVPESGKLLLVSAPEEPFSQEFLDSVRRFVDQGGSLIVCGSADTVSPNAAQELNRLLEAAGSTMRLHDDTAAGPVNNTGDPNVLESDRWNPEASWLQTLESGQVYCHSYGSTVDPGQGVWLVRGLEDVVSVDGDGDGLTGDGQVLLAAEATSSGGLVVAAGCMFLSDEVLRLSDKTWASPSVNQTILQSLLGTQSEQVRQEQGLSVSTISQIRAGQAGEVFRVRGYVTAGTANAANRFARTIYIQDDTGGIPVIPFDTEGIQVGTPLEVTGCLESWGGNLVLAYMGHTVLDEAMYRYVPQTISCRAAMDYATRGGQLLQIQGQVVGVTTDGGQGVRQFTVQDYLGGTATVIIEEGIGAGSTGRNTLASQVLQGRTVRVMGLLHLDVNGQPFLRVRNCEEVVYVPPFPDPSNPKTGDDSLLRRLIG